MWFPSGLTGACSGLFLPSAWPSSRLHAAVACLELYLAGSSPTSFNGDIVVLLYLLSLPLLSFF
jgi:hypothetical protein